MDPFTEHPSELPARLDERRGTRLEPLSG